MHKELDDLKEFALTSGLDAETVAVLMRHVAYESSKKLLREHGFA
jgi:hypothetical protein